MDVPLAQMTKWVYANSRKLSRSAKLVSSMNRSSEATGTEMSCLISTPSSYGTVQHHISLNRLKQKGLQQFIQLQVA